MYNNNVSMLNINCVIEEILVMSLINCVMKL